MAAAASRAFMPELKGPTEELAVNSLVEAGRVFEFDAKFQDAFGRIYRSSGRADWTASDAQAADLVRERRANTRERCDA